MPAKMRTFLRLRAELQAHDIDPRYLGQELGISEQSVGRRLRRETPWALPEMYDVMHMLHWPTERMSELFPEADIRRNP